MMADHVTNRMLRDKTCTRPAEDLILVQPQALVAARSTHVGWPRKQFGELTAMRLPFTTTVPSATGGLFARMITASSS